MSNATPSPQAAAPLKVATMEEIKRDLGAADAAQAADAAADRELDAKADQFVAALLAVDPKTSRRADYAFRLAIGHGRCCIYWLGWSCCAAGARPGGVLHPLPGVDHRPLRGHQHLGHLRGSSCASGP